MAKTRRYAFPLIYSTRYLNEPHKRWGSVGFHTFSSVLFGRAKKKRCEILIDNFFFFMADFLRPPQFKRLSAKANCGNPEAYPENSY